MSNIDKAIMDEALRQAMEETTETDAMELGIGYKDLIDLKYEVIMDDIRNQRRLNQYRLRGL